MFVIILNTVLLVELFLVLNAHFKLIERLPEHRISGDFHWLAWVVCNARLAHFHIGVGLCGSRLGVVVGVRGLALPIRTGIRSAILTS